MLKIETKLLVTTNNKLLKVMLGIIVSSAIVGIFVPASVLMFILFSWKTQCILLLTLMLLFHHNDETLYALVIGSFYISPLVSYVYFNIANGAILLGLSLSVILITICINYLVMNENYPFETMTQDTALSRHGKSTLISLIVIGIGVVFFSSLNIIPLTALLYTASFTFLAIQMIYLRALNILYEANNTNKDNSSIAAMSLFADPLNILMQENNLTNNVFTRLLSLIWSVIHQVLEIPASVFYYLCLAAVKKHWLALEHVPKAVQLVYPEIPIAALKVALSSHRDDIRQHVKIKENVEALAKLYTGTEEELISDLKLLGVTNTIIGRVLNHKISPESKEDALFSHPAPYLYDIKQKGWQPEDLKDVPEKVQLSHPEIPLAAVKKRWKDPKGSDDAEPPLFLYSDKEYKEWCERKEYKEWCERVVPESLKTNVEALAKLYKNSEEQLIKDLKLLRVKNEIIFRVLSHISCNIARESLEDDLNPDVLGILQEYITTGSKDEDVVYHPAPYLYDIKQPYGRRTFYNMPKEVLRAFPEVCLAAVQKNGLALRFLPEDVLLAHPHICLAAVQKRFKDLKSLYAGVPFFSREHDKEHKKWCERVVPESLKTNVEALAKLYKNSGEQLIKDLKLLRVTDEVICKVLRHLSYNIDTKESIQNFIDKGLLSVSQEHKTIESKDEDVVYYSAPYLYDIKQPDWRATASNMPEEVLRVFPNVLLAAVQKHFLALQYVPEDLKDEKLCMAAVQQNGWALQYVPEDLKNEDICRVAVQKNYWALEYLPEGLKRDGKICIAAVQQNGRALEYLPESVQQANPHICAAAVQKNGLLLQYVPADVQRDNRNICMAAVQQNGWALQYVPKDLRNENLYLAALGQKGILLLHEGPEELKRDEKLCMAAVRKNGLALQYVPEAVQLAHPHICLAAVQQNSDALQFVPESLKTNVEALAKLYTNSEKQLIEYLKLLRVENEIICRVLNHLSCEIARKSLEDNINSDVLGILQQYITPESKEDALFSHPAPYLYDIKQSDWKPQDLKDVSEKVQLSHPEIPRAAVKKNAIALRHVPEKVQLSHPDIPLDAAQYALPLQFVSAALKTNVEALAKLYTGTEKKLKGDLRLLCVERGVINKVVNYLSSDMIKECIADPAPDCQQGIANKAKSDCKRDIPSRLLTLIGEYI